MRIIAEKRPAAPIPAPNPALTATDIPPLPSSSSSSVDLDASLESESSSSLSSSSPSVDALVGEGMAERVDVDDTCAFALVAWPVAELALLLTFSALVELGLTSSLLDVCAADSGEGDGDVWDEAGVVVVSVVDWAADVSVTSVGCVFVLVGSGDGTEVGEVVVATRPADEDAAMQRSILLSAAKVTCSAPSFGQAWIIQSRMPF